MHRNQLRIFHGLFTALVAATFAVFAFAPASAVCVGDCSGDGSVTVDEIITIVAIALNGEPADRCEAADRSMDGVITVDEIIASVNSALGGCPTPTIVSGSPTATPTRGATNTPTATPIPPAVGIGSVSGAPGASVTISISLMKKGNSIVTIAPLAFDFDPGILTFGNCAANQQVHGKDVSAGLVLQTRVSVALFKLDDQTVLPDGAVIDCTFTIRSTAARGPTPLTFEFAVMSNGTVTDILATGTDGRVTVQ